MRSNAAESSVFLEVNGAIQFCYVCCAAIPWPFKITSKIWDCYAAIRFLIFGLPILDVCYTDYHQTFTFAMAVFT